MLLLLLWAPISCLAGHRPPDGACRAAARGRTDAAACEAPEETFASLVDG
jgi:hypothetical protein